MHLVVGVAFNPDIQYTSSMFSRKYRALEILDTRQSGWVCNFHPCFPNIAKLKVIKSLKLIPPKNL